jgi:hypothetical protein
MILRYTIKRLFLTFLVTAALVIAGAGTALCKEVTRQEAVAAADLWYVMEINDEHNKMDAAERAARLADIDSREVFYLVSEEDLLDRPPKEGRIFGYVVTYNPTGYVVVSGEDRIEPILVFDIDSPFTWELPRAGFMRLYLERALLARWNHLEERLARKASVPVHRNWSYLRSRLREHASPETVAHKPPNGPRSVFVKWETPLWGQGEFYNETVLAVHGYQWPYLPTGCVATAMAIKMRYHEWPPKGVGSHGYDDDEGFVQHDNHYANFGAQNYWWSAMPMENILAHNPDIANTMYHCGVAVEMDYEVDGSGAETADAAEAMEDHFLYRDHQWNFLIHEPDMQVSILGGIPVQIAGEASQGAKGRHSMIACGYRDTTSPHYYINLGWGGTNNGWYNLDDVSPSHHFIIDGSAPYCQPMGWIYVSTTGSPTGAGTLRDPLQFVAAANAVVPDYGQIWLEAGVHTCGPITFKKKMELKNYHGQVMLQ